MSRRVGKGAEFPARVALRRAHGGHGQALAGTSPVPYESGTYSKPHRRYACIKPLIISSDNMLR